MAECEKNGTRYYKNQRGSPQHGGSSEEFASVLTAPVHILPSFFLDNDKVAAFSASFALTSCASHKRNPAKKSEKEREKERTSSKLTKQKFNIRDFSALRRV